MNYLLSLLQLVVQCSSLIIVYSILTKVRIPLKNYILLPVFVGALYTFFNYFTFVTLILFFFILGKLLSPQKSNNLLWFYSVYTVFSTSLFGYTVFLFASYLFEKSNYTNYVDIIWIIIVPIGIVLLTIFLLKILKPNLDFLRKHIDDLNQIFLFIINILLTICCTIQFTSYWIQYILRIKNPIRMYMIFSFIIIIAILLQYIGNKTREFERKQIQDLKDNQLANLTSYVNQVETMYDEFRSFRHDYHNVLISLNESINTEDVAIIKKTYNQILNKEGLAIEDSHYSLAKLNNLKTLPIKGVFSTHIINAWQKNIAVHLEIEDIIQNEAIDVLDYVRIISILLDNAIEAAENSASPLLTLVFLTSDNGKEIQIMIENSCEEEQIDISKVFQAGFSSKGDNRGVGLSTVNKILKNYPHISLQTEAEPFLFRQILIIKNDAKT